MTKAARRVKRLTCALFALISAVAITDLTPSANATPTAYLSTVRLGLNDGYDRLVFEFTNQVPDHKIGYRPLPVQADPSGEDIPLPGAEAALLISLTPATGAGWTDAERTYFGPTSVAADTAVVTEAKAAGDFEAVLSWVVGVRSEVPYRVDTLDDPPRLVVDVAH